MPISHRHAPLQYGEYINPLPADDIIKLGAIKQASYDQNYEKIQSKIDELDAYGLSLERPQDIEYFSQEMEKYMQAVRESSAKTDFSNLTNVRNILSISRPLENDPRILNAIKSTKELQRRYQTLSSLKPEDRNPVNDWFYLKDVNDWYNNPEPGAVLSTNKQYIPHNDPSEFILENIDKLKSNIREEIVKEGKFIETVTIEEVTNQRLVEWMNLNLPQQYKQQILMDAEYSTKDVDPAEISNHYFDVQNSRLEQVKQQLSRYQLLAASRPLAEDEKQDVIDRALKARVLTDNLSRVFDSPEEAKRAWVNDHYNAYITGQADIYKYRKTKRDLETNLFSLAETNHRLRIAEQNNALVNNKTLARYKEIDLNLEKMGLGISLSDRTSKEEEETKTVIQSAEDLFKKATNSLTKSDSYQPISTNLMDSDELTGLQKVLKNALVSYTEKQENSSEPPLSTEDIPESIDLSKVQVKYNPNGTYSFRIAVDDGHWNSRDRIFEVHQDRFDRALRSKYGIDDEWDYQYSVNTLYKRNESPKEEIDVEAYKRAIDTALTLPGFGPTK